MNTSRESFKGRRSILRPVLLCLCLCVSALQAQQPAAALSSVDTSFFSALSYREIGPMRGGRSVAVEGVDSRPFEYYMGTTGGGVFKTTDGGITWAPITDEYFGGTIGAIDVAKSNPDIVYVGTGEYPVRGNVSHGDGVYRSRDAGKTWTHVGLTETRQISRVRVHPTNPDIVYVGAQGHVWGPNAERGVYKTVDGGRTWKKILYRNDSTGITDLVMDPSDPNTLYAAFWQVYRTPWKLSSGGAGSGIFKTTDGGEHWQELTRNEGLPHGIWGNIGLAVSPVSPNRVWAIIEADSGGVFRSDDGGATWVRTNDERRLRQRAWYYTRIFAGPTDSNEVYVLNTGFYRSTDGGSKFESIDTPHGDAHDLWIAPDDPDRMIEGNDGGANVSFNGGKSWSQQDYGTAQFYHVATSNEFPYMVCGAQQDNSAICVPSAHRGGIDQSEWYQTGGCESGYVAVKPDDPDITFAGCYGGALDMKNRRNGFERAVNPWPENPMGQSAEDVRYRMQWTYPIVFSPHDPDRLYVGSNVIFTTTNLGQHFDVMSPDLTRHDPKTLGPSGGPITKDQTGVETYATVFAIAESPVTAGVIWSGSDDGIIHITRDAGRTWKDVTPPNIGDFTRISIIEPSPYDAGAAYVAANRYQLDDMSPILFKTKDYGATWTRIDNGIARDEFTRVIRADPVRRGLLFAGTERGIWISFDDGAHWQPFQRNLPPVPVHDLAIKNGDLVVATHGRSFWIMDDISPLRQLSERIAAEPAHLFAPADAYRVQWGGRRGGGGGPEAHPVGQNPRDGAVVYYSLATGGQPLTLEFLDSKGNVLQTYRSAPPRSARARADSAAGRARQASEEDEEEDQAPRRRQREPGAPNHAGLNTFAWNLRYPDAVRFEGMIMWAGTTDGPMVAPGTYAVRLTIDGKSQMQEFKVLEDPRSNATQADIEQQVAFLLEIRDRTSDANNAVRRIRNIRAQVQKRLERIDESRRQPVMNLADPMLDTLANIEGEIYQVKNRSNQDPLNYPIKLNNKIAALARVVASADFPPTDQSRVVFEQLSAKLQAQLDAMQAVIDKDLPRLNALLEKMGLPAIVPSTQEEERGDPIADDDV